MGNHVIERTEPHIDIKNVTLSQLDVLEPKFADDFLPRLDLSCREVHTDEGAIRQSTSHGDQIRTVRTPQFEHSAVTDICGRHSKQPGERLQPDDMTLPIGGCRIWNIVVACAERFQHGLDKTDQLLNISRRKFCSIRSFLMGRLRDSLSPKATRFVQTYWSAASIFSTKIRCQIKGNPRRR